MPKPYLRLCVAALVAFGTFASEAVAQNGAYVWSNRMGYTGSISRFATLSDAQNNVNAVSGSPYAVPQRDLGLYLVANNPAWSGAGYPPSAFDFLSSWYSSPVSPSNTTYGFVQINDEDGGSVLSANGVWTNSTFTEFLYTASGANTTPGCAPYYPTIPEDCPRLWNAGNADGSGDATYGQFLSYDLTLMASGLAPASFNAFTGVYESWSDPTAVSGSFRGVFLNTSSDDPGSNGYYRVDLDINLVNWAIEQDSETLYGDYFPNSVFGSSTVVPEPSTYALMGAGLLALGVVARRRRRST